MNDAARHVPGGVAFWTAAAAISLAAGVALALQPDRSRDLLELRSWLDAWTAGTNPYSVGGLWVDYPPHTFLMFAPLSWMPVSWLPPLWAIANLTLSIVAAWLTVRTIEETTGSEFGPAEVRRLTAILLTFGVFRTSLWLGQTMPIAWSLGLVALIERDRRPLLAGVALGLATFKPNLALGFVIVLLVWRKVTVLAIGAVTVLAMTAVFAATIGESLPSLLVNYARGLITMYGPGGHVADWVSLRGLTPPNLDGAVLVYLAIALAWIVALGWRHRNDPHLRAVFVALVLLWTLQAISHQRFNMVMATPAVVLLVARRGAFGGAAWQAAAVALIACFALDLPLVLRLAGWSEVGAFSQRMLIVGLFGCLLAASRRSSRN